jgi:hypothetical protein
MARGEPPRPLLRPSPPNLGIPGLKWGIASAAECVKVRLERTSFATLRPFG